MVKGKFYSFEGGEGSGKGTQCNLLFKYLQDKNLDVVLNHEPGGVELGEEIRRLLLSAKYEKNSLTQTLLFEASRSEYVEKMVKPVIDKGGVFISDRFYDSTTAYQGYTGGVSLDVIDYLNNLVTNINGKIYSPDKVFVLNIPPSIGLERAKKAKNEFEEGDFFEKKKLDFHEKINNAFLDIASKNSEKYVVIDSTKSKEECFNIIKNVIDEDLRLS